MKQKHKKKKKNRKTRKSSWLQSRRKKSSISINDEDRQKLVVTITGEIFQPMRLHYEISRLEDFSASLSKLECIEYDSQKNRWVWFYLGESQSLNFKHGMDINNPVVLGEFLYKSNNKIVLNVRSFERGGQAVEFFDHYISRKILKITHVTICNRLFSLEEVSSIESLDLYFEESEAEIINPEEFLQKLKAFTSGIDNQLERAKMAVQFVEELNKEPTPELETFPVYLYEDGIVQLEMQLNTSKTVAYQHWQGNTGYTAMDAINDVFSDKP
jgi:hypothetical protein